MNEYAVEFDQLLHNYEYDNQQYIKSIEKEKQLIKDLSRGIEMTRLSITKLQESVSDMDESTKRIHKQYTMNRDNCMSLKKTSALLTQHYAALTTKLDTFSSKYKQEQAENQKMLDHYWNIWKDYDAKYQSLTFVQVLEYKMKEISITENHLEGRKQEQQKLITKLADLQGFRPLNSQEFKKFLVDLSQIKLNSIKKQESISLLETRIKQKNIEKKEASMTFRVNSTPEEPELNKKNVQPDMCSAPEEQHIPERMDDQFLDNMDNDYGPLKKSQSFEPKMNVSLPLGNSSFEPKSNVSLQLGNSSFQPKTNVSLQLGNSSFQPKSNVSLQLRNSSFQPKTNVSLQLGNSSNTCGNNQISKTCENTSPAFQHGSLFKQPDVNYVKNQRNNALNTKPVSLSPVSTINTFIPEDITMSPKPSISETADKFANADARPTERTDIAMPSLHPPLIQKFMLNQASPGNFYQSSKCESDRKIASLPSTPVHNSFARVQIGQPVSHAFNQNQAEFTPPLFPPASPQIPIPVSNLNSKYPTSSQQSMLCTPPEVGPIPPENNEGMFDFGEHQRFLKKFHDSPGAPCLTQRPMFDLTDQKTNDEDDEEKKRVENPFFLQSFFNEQDEIATEPPATVKSPEPSFLSPYADPFSGFNQNNGNEITASPMDLGFSNSLAERTTSETNFFSFDTNSQAEESTSDFTFNFNSSSNSDNGNNTTFSLF